MTSDFHVHGPHDHHLEHAGQAAAHSAHDGSRASRLAMITAVLATVGAMCSYQAGNTQAEASLAKNDAAIRKTEASDQWNYYQAKNQRLSVAELALDLVPAGRRADYEKTIAKVVADKDQIQAQAHRLEDESKTFDERSERLMHQHHRWAGATMLLQISIALAAITLLTDKRWLEVGTLLVAAVGVATGVAAALHI